MPSTEKIMSDAWKQIEAAQAIVQEWRKALEWIATHYEGADLGGDPSSQRVLHKACDALGWTVEKDEDCQIKIGRR